MFSKADSRLVILSPQPPECWDCGPSVLDHSYTSIYHSVSYDNSDLILGHEKFFVLILLGGRLGQGLTR